jgi:hypothetical protein
LERAASGAPRSIGPLARLRPNSGELTLEFTVLDTLKAEQQLLVEHRRDPAECCQLWHVRPVLEAGNGRMGSTGCVGHLLLSETEFKASLPQMGGNRIGLAKLANLGIFVAGISIGAASPGASLCRPLDSLPDWILCLPLHQS